MVEIRFMSDKGEHTVNSGAVEGILKLMADFDYVKDISNTIKQENIMVFDCKLDKEVFKYEEIDDEFYEDLEVEDEYFQVLFDDIKDYLKDVLDDVEDDLREEYKNEEIQCHYEIYDVDETFTDVKFVFAVAFKDMKRIKLVDLTRIVSKRQLEGSSKYFN